MLPIQTVALCVALSGACGLRAFLPLFYLVLALHTGLLPVMKVNHHLLKQVDLVGSTSVLLLLAALALGEVLVEKYARLAERLELPLLLCKLLSAGVMAFALVGIRDAGNALTASLILGTLGVVPVLNLHAHESAHDIQRLPPLVHFCSSLLTDGICLFVVAVGLQVPYLGLAFLLPATWLADYMTGIWRAHLRHSKTVETLPEAPEIPGNWAGAHKGDI